jgi:hypothetical protein
VKELAIVHKAAGVMKYCESGAALAADMSVPVSVLEETHELPVKTEPFLRGHI